LKAILQKRFVIDEILPSFKLFSLEELLANGKTGFL